MHVKRFHLLSWFRCRLDLEEQVIREMIPNYI